LGPNSNWRAIKVRAGSGKKPAQLSHFGLVQADGFKVLEVWELLDCSLHALPAHGLKDAEKRLDLKASPRFRKFFP
jgi:hypothetical protein